MEFPPSPPRANRRLGLRAVLAVLVAVFLASALAGYVETTGEVSKSQIQNQADLPQTEREQLVETRADITVVTTSPRQNTQGSLTAFYPNGTLAYYNETHRKYFDVDPAPTGETTVEYVAGTELGSKNCPASGVDPCSIVVIERVDLSTGEVTQLHERYVPGSTIWHDVDRIDDHRFLIADIVEDSVFVYNVTSGITTWRWDVASDYPITQGGQVDDWTHLNDVEVIDEGLYMASLRNADQVVFIDREEGLVEHRTLGSEDNYSVLYEQHNPDYIPRENGGPAVVVSDSENNRVIEYQWSDGSWEPTWRWSDTRMQWPRDADRLPDGHTLIADSNGNRIVELDRDGEVVWQVRVDTPYEVERLGTGDESTGGESARSLGLTSRDGTATGDATEDRDSSSGIFDSIVDSLKTLFPGVVENALLFILPAWITPQIFLSSVVAVGLGVVWSVAELYWRGWRVSFRVGRYGRGDGPGTDTGD